MSPGARSQAPRWPVPFGEEAEDGAGGGELFDCAVGAEEQAGEVSAVGVLQAAFHVAVFGEEHGGVGAVDGVVVEGFVDAAQKQLRLLAGHGELAAEVGLEVGHEQSGGDAFAGDVADEEAEAVGAEGEEIVVVAADVAGLDADAGVVEGLERGRGLREEPRLDFAGDLQLLFETALGFDALGGGAALVFDEAAHFVGAEELEGIAIDVD